MHQRAVPAPGLRVPPRVRRHALVPDQRRQAHRRARRVLLCQELVPHVPATAAVVGAGIARAAGEQDEQRNAQSGGAGEASSGPTTARGTRHGTPPRPPGGDADC